MYANSASVDPDQMPCSAVSDRPFYGMLGTNEQYYYWSSVVS